MNARLKSCRRCGGDLFPDRSDREGRTMTCLQCGAEFTLSFRIELTGVRAAETTQAAALAP